MSRIVVLLVLGCMGAIVAILGWTFSGSGWIGSTRAFAEASDATVIDLTQEGLECPAVGEL